jgi:hypothetical protein
MSFRLSSKLPTRSQSHFPHSIRSVPSDSFELFIAVARKLKVFTSRENVATSREALREVLAEGRLILRPDVPNARFEGSLVLSHEEFIEQSKYK